MRRPIPSLLASIAVLAVGCGSSGHPSTHAAAPAATASTASTVAATATATAVTTSTPGSGCAPVTAPAPHPDRTNESPPTGRLSGNRHWTVILDTNCGLISIALAVAEAPKTTSAFAGLVRRGFFDDLTFHRVSNGPDGTPFVIQGGDPLGDGSGGPGYSVVEPPPSSLDYKRGVVAMAKTQTEPSGASGSQFFIVTAADAGLPADYALLGHVSAGMAAVMRIAAVPTGGNELPVSPVVIRRATLSSR